ncbi:MAG: hypothetical protein WBA12_00905, partial [Catalinimonas sp.]
EKGMQEGMRKGMQKGIEKGMQEGIEKGMQEGIREVALNAIRKGKSDALITELTGLTQEEIEALRYQNTAD